MWIFYLDVWHKWRYLFFGLHGISLYYFNTKRRYKNTPVSPDLPDSLVHYLRQSGTTGLQRRETVSPVGHDTVMTRQTYLTPEKFLSFPDDSMS